MKKQFVRSLAIGLGLLFVVSISHAATLDIRDGRLFGASDVDVDGVFYDVAFLDGTLAELYDGADQNADFPFAASGELNASSYLAYAASQALHDQVFIGIYDTNPTLINGIYATSATTKAHILTPFWIINSNSIRAKNATNSSDGIFGSDQIYNTGIAPDFDTAWWVKDPNVNDENDATVIAVWSSASPVPIPGAVWLLGTGLASLAGIKTRRKKK
jgi:hypothetical protein